MPMKKENQLILLTEETREFDTSNEVELVNLKTIIDQLPGKSNVNYRFKGNAFMHTKTQFQALLDLQISMVAFEKQHPEFAN